MANLFNLTCDSKGYWRRQNLGLKLAEGDLKKVTFSLGKKLAEAGLRAATLEKMWSAVEADWQQTKPTAVPIWSDGTLAIALAVARGEEAICLDIPDEVASLSAEAHWLYLAGFQRLFPFLNIKLRGEAGANAEAAGDKIQAKLDGLAERARALADQARVSSNSLLEKIESEASQYGKREKQNICGESLHTALDSYSAHLKATKEPGNYRSKKTQIGVIKRHVPDEALPKISADRIEAILAHFGKRPLGQSNKPMAFNTCKGLQKTFRHFLKWLNRTTDYAWEFPRAFNFSTCKVAILPSDREKKKKVFTRQELIWIWQCATPYERAIICLGLNCAFGSKEIATLRVSEVEKGKNKRAGMTFIKRYRGKTGVYAEWVLWDITLAALDYLKGLHKPVDGLIVASKRGKGLNNRANGHDNPAIANYWVRIMNRVKKEHPDFVPLPFGGLRKTSGNFVRKLGGPELATMQVSHGEKNDNPADPLLQVYTERTWRKLHKVLIRLREKLDCIFSSVSEPWKGLTHKITPLVRDKMVSLRSEGKSLTKIAGEVGLSWITVQRFFSKANSK